MSSLALLDAAVPAGAAVLFGLSAGVLSYAFTVQLGRRMDDGTTRADRLKRRARRGDGSSSALLPVAMVFLPVFVALARLLGLASVQDTLAKAYARAGWPGGLDDEEVMGLGLMLGVLVALPVVAVIALVEPLAAPFGLVVALGGPGLLSSSLSSRGKARELAITRTMPFVLDLLVLTMRAGASLQQAIQRVSMDYAGHPIGVEFNAVLIDLDMGVTTTEAFENLAERVPIDAIKAFVDDLVGAEELGRPLADIFERQADQARIRRVQEALDTAGRAKVLVLVPGMLVFLAALLLLFAPFVVRYYYGGYTV